MTASANSSARYLAGECFCRAVRYQVADVFSYALNCHCSNCRRATGAAFKPFAAIGREKFSVVSGVDDLLVYGDGKAHDAHCRHCGSLLYSVVRDGAFVHVAMGTLLDAPSIRPTAHIFVGSKAPWYAITDDLPQYREHVTRDAG
ncbi:GFA family protein [Bradyrhizobium lablabi]|uniref:GFA family protein n=1 Tax=Bradyrhizobium lablabi TaxID=722472 RepID=UPI001BA79668|nr:GFA family protein [Bradyrhizobium lablabi]MBR0692169.1 GFA family protein [Bradyrhizobium lablabi]